MILVDALALVAATTFKVGIDVGGTFTDLYFWASSGEVEAVKVLTTPRDPSLGVIEGLRTFARSRDLVLEELTERIGVIVHGTTVTTNAVLTRRGAKTGLLTTRGVRDALEMRRGVREEHYNNRARNVVPLVPRHRRLPVGGRMDYRGVELTPLALDDVRAGARALRDDGVAAVAICFMNAFANPAHERAAAEVVRAELPGVFVSVSTEVLPTIRFYNRISTTVLDAYTGPVLKDYLTSLTAKLADTGFAGVLLIMQSSGGVALPGATMERPANTLLSGPAAGPSAGLATTAPLGRTSCLVVDMGGTSFDASLVRDGHVAVKSESDIDRLRIALPMLDIATIGAGGGSIGWIDAGGLLRMGPESAGAEPGPACYGRGGERPTCTDANVVLGYLDPTFFAGGKLTLQPERARRAIASHVAAPLGLDVEQAAAGMYRVINANMAHGVRDITVKRGLDPREFPMVVAGGAGGLHACMIARELDIPTIVVPAMASTLCAAGMLLCDFQHDFVRSFVTPLAAADPTRLAALIAAMVSEGDGLLHREGVPKDRVRHEVALDLRYFQQYHEVTVALPREAAETRDLTRILPTFHAEHDRLYGYELSAEGTGLELINVRVRSLGATDKPSLPRVERGGADASAAKKGLRRAFVPETGAFADMPVYDGHRLRAGNAFVGPALIERTDTTILVGASFAAHVDDHGTCVLEATK